jgi:hypothetical protein
LWLAVAGLAPLHSNVARRHDATPQPARPMTKDGLPSLKKMDEDKHMLKDNEDDGGILKGQIMETTGWHRQAEKGLVR